MTENKELNEIDHFNKWIYEACNLKALKLIRKDAHDIYPYVDLTDAKLAYLDGMSALEYSYEIQK